MKEDKGRIPLRIILNNFLNHIEKLESLRSPEDSYEKEFQDLKCFSENLKGQKQYASTEGEKEANRKKNRYKDILPFDFSRVVLSEYAGTAGSDYINANFIKGASGSPAYIASQGPLPHTVNDFWRMVVECEVHVIIMACNEDEAGKHKCEKYWVDREGEVKQFGMVRIRLLQGSNVCPDFSVRTIKIEYTNKDSSTEERTVCQFHYSAWPDHGVPPSVRPLLDMVRLVRDTQASETLPVLVHCSAGCGRTGTICAIDYVWGLLRAGKLTKDFSLLSLVREMRRQRVAMVQTTEQYILVHRAVRELFREQLRVIDSHPYENIDVDGVLLYSKNDEEPVYESICAAGEPQNSVVMSQSLDDSSPAPPLPRKNRFHVAASKHEKEVENQTEKQRNSQGGAGGIAKLKAMFERSPVSRSQSLGRRQASATAVSDSTPEAVPPVLPIKRSKSLRILGSGERNKLSLLANQDVSSTQTKAKPSSTKSKVVTGGILRRRRSFESNNSPKPMRRSLHLDDEGRKLLQDCKVFLSRSSDAPPDPHQRLDNVVSGIGIRERRDSFRQAISKRTADIPQKRNSASRPQHSTVVQDDVDEVDSGPLTNPGPKRTSDGDKIDSRSTSVIIVKPDRTSPKLDLYVKSLPGETTAHKTNRHVENSDGDILRKFGLVWNRAATSVDLKSNLRNSDLSLQELKSCLRREGTAHELKLRKDESGVNVSPVKLYKSLDRMVKKENDTWDTHLLQQASSDRKPYIISPHRSPQTTVDRRHPLSAPISPHRSPQTTVDRRNPVTGFSNPHLSPQTTMDRRTPLSLTSSPHHSPQASVDRRNPITSLSPHQSPQTTVDRRNSLTASSSPHQSPQTTVDRRNPPTTSSSPLHSPQTTVDRRNPLNALTSSPHHSPQTTVDRRNPLNAVASSPHHSPQTTVDRRNPLNAVASSPHHSPQTSVDRRNPLNAVASSPHHSPQTTVDRRNPLTLSASSPHRSPQTTVDRRSTLASHASPQSSPQATADRRIPYSPNCSPQTTVEHRNAFNPHASPHQSPQSTSNCTSPPSQHQNLHRGSDQSLLSLDQRSGGHSAPVHTHRPLQQVGDRRNPLHVSAPKMLMGPSNDALQSPPPPRYLPGSGQRPPAPSELRSTPHSAQGGQRPPALSELRSTPHTTQGGLSPEPYSYGLVASVLRRGSQDDLALCASGNTGIVNKGAQNSPRPCAPPRIKRHASVVLPRKSGANKEQNPTMNSTPHGDQKKWPAKVSLSIPQKMPLLPPPPDSTSSQTIAPSANSNSTSANVIKTRSSQRRSAASSLSRALGALQLRRNSDSGGSNSVLKKPPGNPVSVLSSSTSNVPSVSSVESAVSPTLVITPTKPVMPQGIIEEGRKPLLVSSRIAGAGGMRPLAAGQVFQDHSSYVPHRHPHPHPHPHPQPQPQHLSPLRPPLQPYQHHHPPTHHAFPHQHPKTYKKQEYL